MSLFGDLEDDPIFGHHMHSMRQMDSMMNSIFNGDPFGGLFGGHHPFNNMLTAAPHFPRMPPQNSLMPFGFMPPHMGRMGFMPNMMPDPASASYTSTSYVSMTSGPDGRPQIYQASSSTKTGPHGVMETKKTVQDSRTGLKKMAIGHHIGERAHIIEREQNLRQGTEEERQDFINLEEEEADDFNREFLSKVNHRGAGSHSGPSIQCIETGPLPRRELPAIMPPQAVASTTDEGPIIELPESPSPPPVPADEVDSASTRRGVQQTEIQSVDDDDDEEEEAQGGPVCSNNDTPSRYGPLRGVVVANSPLGVVQPRRPIRTHQASPLATHSSSPALARHMQQFGHNSTKSGAHGHPYSSQGSRQKSSHRPMKGGGGGHHQQQQQQQQHNNYHHNPQQYERDN